MGGEEPLPLVPARGRLQPPGRRAQPQDRARRRAAARRRNRRPWLGQHASCASVCRPTRQHPGRVRTRRHARVLPGAGRSPYRRAPRGRGRGRALRLELRRRRRHPAADRRGLQRRGAPAGALRARHQRHGRRRRRRRLGDARRRRDPGARPADRGSRRLHRRRRRQSRPPDHARRRGLLLPPLPRRHAQRVFPPRPHRLPRRQELRGDGLRRRTAGLGQARRTLAQPGLPSLALRLSAAHRARARDREPARRGHVPAARLHRRDHRGRTARHGARARAQLHAGPQLHQPGARPDRPAAAMAQPRETAPSRPRARSRAAHGRSERHRFLRAGRRRHHRVRPPTACCSAAAA